MSFSHSVIPECFYRESRSKVTLVLDARPTSSRSRFDVNIETDLKSAGMTKRVFFGFFDQGVFDHPSASRIPSLLRRGQRGGRFQIHNKKGCNLRFTLPVGIPLPETKMKRSAPLSGRILDPCLVSS